MKFSRCFLRFQFIFVLVFVVNATIAAAQVAPPRASASPTPIPIPTPLPTPTPQTLPDLRAKIRQSLAKPALARGQVGVKIISLNSGKVIFEQNSEKYFMPASNMKNFTVATAIEKLSPDFRFVTSVFSAALPDTNGTISGDLRIFGRGDISISYSFYDGDNFRGIDNLVDRIVAAGVKRVEGSLIADESYFRGNAVNGSWEYEDLQWYYGAEVSALPVNDSSVELAVTPGPLGYGCTTRVSPTNLVVRVINLCTTTAFGSPRSLKIEKKVDENVYTLSGNLPLENPGFKGSLAVSHPAELFVSLLKQRLAAKGVTVLGGVRTENNRELSKSRNIVEVARLESPPLALIAAKTMKPSQNMYAETLLWTLGENTPMAADNQTPKDSSELGLVVVHNFLNSIGIPSDAILQYDGSGLSRHNLVTPAAVVRLYAYMAKESKNAIVWRDSLTIGGIDGTLANRFKGTAAAGNMRGKTGTIDQVSALSGYVNTASGEPLVVSLIVNGVPQSRDRTGMIDEIVINLANFNGKIDQP